MTPRPILLNGPMVRAILREIAEPGTGKTMTRRLAWLSDGKPAIWQSVKPGDVLWVRETWGAGTRPDPNAGWRDGIEFRADGASDDVRPLHDIEPPDGVEMPEPTGRWRHSIHMPRWASRLTLMVEAVRVERLQEITEEDAIAEGARRFDDIPLDPAHRHHTARADRWSMGEPKTTGECLGAARYAFASLWNDTYGPDAWGRNPEVVAIRFRPVARNVDDATIAKTRREVGR